MEVSHPENFHIREYSNFNRSNKAARCSFESDSNFPFPNIFDDLVDLIIEIIPDTPETYSDCDQGCTVDTVDQKVEINVKTDSSWSMDWRSTVLSINIIRISSSVLAVKSKFFCKLLSNGMIRDANRSQVTIRMPASEAAVHMESLHVLNLDGASKLHERRPLLVRWIPPSFGKLKLNLDGASKGNPGLAGCGGVLRSHSCGFIFAFSRFLKVGTSIYAELSALKYGLMVCSQLNITQDQVVVETDSMLAVKWLKNGTRPPRQYCDLWDDILQLHSRFSCEVIHVYREGNFLADGLANYGAEGNEASFSSLSQLPKNSLAIFALDRAGVPHIRH